jgi:hypothetical protein
MEMFMKMLDMQEMMAVSGGENKEYTEVSNGSMSATMHVPPHNGELCMTIQVDIDNASLTNFRR